MRYGTEIVAAVRAGRPCDIRRIGVLEQVLWQEEDLAKNLQFFSISSDGRVTLWTMSKNELQYRSPSARPTWAHTPGVGPPSAALPCLALPCRALPCTLIGLRTRPPSAVARLSRDNDGL